MNAIASLMPRRRSSLELARTLDVGELEGPIADRIDHVVRLHDETLRDGEQTVGVSFTVAEKVELAELLIDAGVRSLTVGFPAVSEDEREAATAIAALGSGAELYAFCRAKRGDVDLVRACGIDGVGMFIPISDVHLDKLRLSVDGAFERMQESIRFAREHGLRTRFGFEDASRAPLDRILRFAAGAVEAGASQITFGDTVGVLTPFSSYGLMRHVRATIGPDVPIFTHFHDDLGMATANSIAAVVGGASFVMGSLCGLGERTGNAAHEEVATALRVRYGVDCGVDLAKLTRAAHRAAEISGLATAANKPVIGANAFRHESGIHVHGLLEERATYEPYPPELVGAEHEVYFGKHAGLANVKALVEAAGLDEVDDETLLAVLAELKSRAIGRGSFNAEEAAQIAHEVIARSKERQPIPGGPSGPKERP